MAYVTIPSADYDVDSPLTTGLMGNIINNIDHTVERTRRLLNFFGDAANGVITYSSNQSVNMGIYLCTNWTLNSGVTITLTPRGIFNTFIVLCTGTATIQGTINGTGSGPDNVTGVRPGGGSGGGGGGGSSGGSAGLVGSDGHKTLYNNAGVGGIAEASGTAGVAIDANVLQSRLLMHSVLSHDFGGALGGGGGAGGDGGVGGAAGRGGAGIVIMASVINFTSTGVITSNGGAGSSGTTSVTSGGGGGGGGAGAQLMAADTYTNNAGTRNFTGGSGGASVGTSGGGGAGGAGTSLIVFNNPRS